MKTSKCKKCKEKTLLWHEALCNSMRHWGDKGAEDRTLSFVYKEGVRKGIIRACIAETAIVVSISIIYLLLR